MSLRLTREGHEKLREEYEYLRTTKRQEIRRALEVARSHGDLRENAEYDSAKHEQGLVEKRIAELQEMLAHATMLDESAIDTSRAYLGALVTVCDLTAGKEMSYRLVSKAEANLREGKISIESPVGRALLGKEPSAEVEITIPAGTLRYKIVKIER